MSQTLFPSWKKFKTAHGNLSTIRPKSFKRFCARCPYTSFTLAPLNHLHLNTGYRSDIDVWWYGTWALCTVSDPWNAIIRLYARQRLIFSILHNCARSAYRSPWGRSSWIEDHIKRYDLLIVQQFAFSLSVLWKSFLRAACCPYSRFRFQTNQEQTLRSYA